MCCLKNRTSAFPSEKSFFGHNCPERFSCFWHLDKFCHKNSKIFFGTTAFHYQNGMQYVTCIVTTLRTVILVMYYKITRSLGSYTFYVFLFLFPMGLEKWSNRPASEKKESLFLAPEENDNCLENGPFCKAYILPPLGLNINISKKSPISFLLLDFSGDEVNPRKSWPLIRCAHNF